MLSIKSRLTFLVVLLSLSQLSISQVLLAEYTLDGDTKDKTGNCQNGNISGATDTVDRFSNSESAYFFDGVNDIISVNTTDSIDLDGYKDNYSVSLWFKSKDPTPGSTGCRLIEKGNITPVGYPFSFQVGDLDSLHLMVYDGSNLSRISVLNIWDDKWHHLVFVVDNLTDSIHAYIDNSLYGSAKNNCTSSAKNTDLLKIGGSSSRYYQGALDDIRIYGDALDNSQVDELFESRICDSINVVNDTNRVNVYDTIQVYDTMRTQVYDTIIRYDTMIVYDTLFVYDTLTIIDTIPIYDTLSVYDTIGVTDTLFVDVVLSGVTPITTNTLKVYPNPAKDFIIFNFGDYSSMKGYQFRISTSTGKEVMRRNITTPSLTISTDQFDGLGIYTLIILDKMGAVVASKKIVFQ